MVEAKKKFFIWKFLKQMTRGNVWCSCQAKGWKILNRDINICKEKKMFLTFIACLVARRPAQPPMQCLTSVLFRDLSGRCVKPTANETACPYVFREATSIFKKRQVTYFRWRILCHRNFVFRLVGQVSVFVLFVSQFWQ